MTSTIPNPPTPSPAVFQINAGDSVIFFDHRSQTYIGGISNNGPLAVTSAGSALVFSVGFNGATSPAQTTAVITYGGLGGSAPSSTNITLQNSSGYLYSQSTLGEGILQLNTPGSVVNNQQYLWTFNQAIDIFDPVNKVGQPITAALVGQVPGACNEACNAFGISNAADTKVENPIMYVPSQASQAGSTPAFFQMGSKGSFMSKPQTCIFEMYLVAPSTPCGSNTDCTSTNSPYCYNSKCYATNMLSTNQVSEICSFTSLAPTNNITTPVCQNWCVNQPLNTAYRTNCDLAMSNYCPAAFPSGVTHPPPTSSPCTCVLAAASGIAYPECFYTPCAVQGAVDQPQNYYTTSMQNDINQKNCLQNCQVQFQCVDAGTCTVSNDLFCETCANASNPAISQYCSGGSSNGGGGGGASPSFISKAITWIKSNLPIAIGAGVGAIVLLVLLIIVLRQILHKKSNSTKQ